MPRYVCGVMRRAWLLLSLLWMALAFLGFSVGSGIQSDVDRLVPFLPLLAGLLIRMACRYITHGDDRKALASDIRGGHR